MKGNIRDFARSVETWTTLLLLLMSGYLLSIAHSATSLFCVLIGSLIIFGTSRPILNKNLRIVAYRVVSISVLLAFAQIFFNISNLIIATLGRDPTLTNRTFIWEFLLGMGTNPIVGVGYESFWTTNRILYAASSGYAVLQSHNGYIETYLNLGFIGVMFFMAFLVKCFRIVVRDLPAEFTLNQFRLAFLIVFGLYNYTEAAFPSPGLLGPIFFLFIIVVPRTSSQQVLDIDFDNASPAGS